MSSCESASLWVCICIGRSTEIELNVMHISKATCTELYFGMQAMERIIVQSRNNAFFSMESGRLAVSVGWTQLSLRQIGVYATVSFGGAFEICINFALTKPTWPKARLQRHCRWIWIFAAASASLAHNLHLLITRFDNFMLVNNTTNFAQYSLPR